MAKKKRQVLAKTDNLYLSPLLEDYAPTLALWFNDAEVYEVMRDMSFQTNEATERQWIRQCHQDPTHHMVAIFYLPEDKLIGYGGFKNIQVEDRSAELWIVIGEKEYWGRGLGKEGRWLICSYGFDTLGYHNILGEHYAINQRSLNNALSTGAKLLGTRRQSKWLHGRFLDVHYTDMLREDLIQPCPSAGPALGKDR